MIQIEDFRKEIGCVYIAADGRCLKDQEPGYVGWCVLGPCSEFEPINGREADRHEDQSD